MSTRYLKRATKLLANSVATRWPLTLTYIWSGFPTAEYSIGSYVLFYLIIIIIIIIIYYLYTNKTLQQIKIPLFTIIKKT